MEPFDAIEHKRAMESIAEAAWHFYAALRKEGFLQADAMRLTATWLSATIRTAGTGEDADNG